MRVKNTKNLPIPVLSDFVVKNFNSNDAQVVGLNSNKDSMLFVAAMEKKENVIFDYTA